MTKVPLIGGMRMFSNIPKINIDKNHLPTFEELREAEFIQNVKEGTSKLMTEFTFKEQMQVSFVPLIIENLVWYYADRVTQQAARDKIDILKKLGRAVKHIRGCYYDELKKDLDSRHLSTIDTVTKEFLTKFNSDCTIMWFTVKQEFIRTMPNYPYQEMRTDAIMAILIIDCLRHHNREMDALILKRLGHCDNSIMKKTIDKLETCMEAYAGEVGKFNYKNNNIILCLNILKKNIGTIEFKLDK